MTDGALELDLDGIGGTSDLRSNLFTKSLREPCLGRAAVESDGVDLAALSGESVVEDAAEDRLEE